MVLQNKLHFENIVFMFSSSNHMLYYWPAGLYSRQANKRCVAFPMVVAFIDSNLYCVLFDNHASLGNLENIIECSFENVVTWSFAFQVGLPSSFNHLFLHISSIFTWVCAGSPLHDISELRLQKSYCKNHCGRTALMWIFFTQYLGYK